MHLPFFLFFSSKPNLNSAPINELQSPLFPYIGVEGGVCGGVGCEGGEVGGVRCGV